VVQNISFTLSAYITAYVRIMRASTSVAEDKELRDRPAPTLASLLAPFQRKRAACISSNGRLKLSDICVAFAMGNV
jgi:hypothetical protein